MFKRIAMLGMMLAGSMAMLTPAVAQARDFGYGYHRYDHRDCRRWEHRDYRHDYWRR